MEALRWLARTVPFSPVATPPEDRVQRGVRVLLGMNGEAPERISGTYGFILPSFEEKTVAMAYYD